MKRNFGFTLAETLIVIGIIGVVAALTLPNLNHATGDKEKVTKVKKIYAALTEAFDRAQAIYGDVDTWYSHYDTDELNKVVAERVTEFMKVSKVCGFEPGCFSTAPLLDIDGSVYTENYLEDLDSDTYMLILADGMSIGFNDFHSWSARIIVDIDGPNKGKNQIGNDLFSFVTCPDKDCAGTHEVYTSDSDTGFKAFKVKHPDVGQVSTKYGDSSTLGCTTGNFEVNSGGVYSTAWVIENGNLDYLKCPDELNWETQTSCK